jgi:succinylglutamate desuccinylase
VVPVALLWNVMTTEPRITSSEICTAAGSLDDPAADSAADPSAIEVSETPDLPQVPSSFGAPEPAGRSVPRVLGRLDGPEDGPMLVCVAGLHGNEPAGVLALERVFRALRGPDGDGSPGTHGADGAPGLQGRFVGLAGNLKALARRCRFLDLDLNRIWTGYELDKARRRPAAAEDEEMVELARHLEELLGEIPEERRHEIFVLDLHTASGPGPAFTVLDDTLPNREFALDLQAPVVLGIEEELEGTLMHYVSDLGFTAVGFESGRHDDPAAVDLAEAAVWIALETSGVLAPGHPRVAKSRERLIEASRALPRVVEVRYRHAISPEVGFRIREGLAGFERVAEGQILGTDRRGSIPAREPGLVLMPLYQEQGDEGFFLVRPVRPMWLSISKFVRRLHVERVLHWLPGVRRHPELPKSFLVDRKIARWVAPQLFHLLGFRRQGPGEDRYLVMSRRFGDR